MIEEIEKEYEYMWKVLGVIPKKIKMSKAKCRKLAKECLGMHIEDKEIFDRSGNAVAPFMGMKIIIDDRIKMFVMK